jgi:hypothetical protein
MKLRIRGEREHKGYLVRVWWDWVEVAYLVLGLRGLKAEIEFPSDWHEHRRAWVRLGFGLFTLAFSFPWRWVVPDDYQCSGPTYGFSFFQDGLHLHWGKCHGKRSDPMKVIQMPWGWRHRLHEVLGEPETHAYRYNLRSGKVQERTATIKPERRLWTRPWLPYKRESRYIDVEFSEEVGERSGSWKGGCTGCSYEMLPTDTPLTALRRMELERKF